MGVGAAVFTLVGFVIGMAPFIFPGELAAKTGPGLFIAYLIAGLLALFSCFIAAQISGILPISGAGYIGASVVLSPYFGFILVWMVMMCMVVGMPILGYGFADYLAYFFPGLPRPLVAAAAIAGFGFVNLAGVKSTVLVQALLVSLLLVILVVFGAGGAAHMKPELMRPLLPNGWPPIFEAAIIAYYAYGGFMVIAEIGDEIKNPSRTVPISLAISFLIILAIYLMVAIVLPGLIPWQTLKEMPAPLAKAAETFLPHWCGGFIAFSALLGAAVNINAWFLTQTRDIYAMARDQILPKALAHVSAKRGDPDAAIIFATILAIGGVCLGASVAEYATMVVLAMCLIQVMAGVTILLAPSRLPDLYAKSPIKLGRFGLPFFAIGFILMSLAFAVIGAIQSLRACVVFVALLAIGSAYYHFRRRFLRSIGVSIEDALKKDIARLR